MEQPKSRNRIFGLDLMRAMAIAMVLLGHCAWIFPGGDTPLKQVLALSGYMGVEFFFVLSGFLIGQILFGHFTREKFTLATVKIFLKRRWFRTLPNYFLILIVNIILAAIMGYHIEGLWRYFIFMQNFVSPMLPFFTESWSLSVEEFAYVLLPLFLLLIGTLSGQKNKRTLFSVGILLLVGVFFGTKIIYHVNTSNTTIEQWNLALKSVVAYRLDSIFIGVLASWLYVVYGNFWRRTKMLLLVLGLVMMAFFTFGVGWFRLLIDQYPFFWNVIYLPLTSISVAFFLPFLSEWKIENSFIRRPVTFISLISYSIYLLHYSVVLQTMKHFIDTDHLSPSGIVIFTAVYLIGTIVLSAFLFRFYEKPMTDRRDSQRYTS